MAHTLENIDNIKRQAHQGSVAAIIQILNERLANRGVRSRAVLVEGVLQLLCEAAQPEQLEQALLTQEVKQILEDIAPRNIHRVNINSRIVREQQLLWLEEINRDREKQLLWSEEIALSRPNFFQSLFQQAQEFQLPSPKNRHSPQPDRSNKPAKRSFRRGLLGGVAITALVFAVGTIVASRQLEKITNPNWSALLKSPSQPSPQTVSSPQVEAEDPFAEAVRLAETASAAGKDAQTTAEWSDISLKWQQASNLMAAVPVGHNRYVTAQDRMIRYRQNSEIAQQQAKTVANKVE
ncbi:MAG: hypothetical protein WA865_21620 [Spirulinaceae cyanobacterium]